MEEEIIRITVSEVLEEVKQYQKEFDPEGLCIYFATNIGSLLAEQEISYDRFKISDYIATDYYHEFIVTKPDEEGNAFLIDPTYGQFAPKDQKLVRFKEWPLNILIKTEKGKKIASELCENGLCKTNEQGIKIYLASFDVLKKPEEINFSFDNQKSR